MTNREFKNPLYDRQVQNVLRLAEKTNDVKLLVDNSLNQDFSNYSFFNKFYRRFNLMDNWFDCGRYAVSSAMERHFPLLVAFIEKKYMEIDIKTIPPNLERPEFFVKAISKIYHTAMNNESLSYEKLANLNEPENVKNDPLSALVNNIEKELNSGFLLVASLGHVELYVQHINENNKSFVRRKSTLDAPEDLWEIGKFHDWVENYLTSLNFGSNHKILPQDLKWFREELHTLHKSHKLLTKELFAKAIFESNILDEINKIQNEFSK